MKYVYTPFTPLSAEAQKQTFDDIVAGFIQMGQGEDFDLFTKTGKFLAESCDPEDTFVDFLALDVLTLTLYRYASQISMPLSHAYDVIASTTRFADLMGEVIQLSESSDAQTQARMLAWRTFLETAIGRLRGPLFPGARTLEVTSKTGKLSVVEIDSFAVTTVTDLRIMVEEQRFGITTEAVALNYFTDRIPYGKWNTKWNDFCSTIESDVRNILAAELVRLVSNAFGARFEKVA